MGIRTRWYEIKLREARNDEEKIEAMWGLEKHFNNKRVAEVLFQFLIDDSKVVRERAHDILFSNLSLEDFAKMMKTETSDFRALKLVATDEAEAVRLRTAEKLAEAACEGRKLMEAREIIIRSLDDWDKNVRFAGLWAVCKCAEKGIRLKESTQEKLLGLMNDGDGSKIDVTYALAKAAENGHDISVCIHGLVYALADNEDKVRGNASNALRRTLSNPETREETLDELIFASGYREDVTYNAIDFLENITDSYVLESLIEKLDREEPYFVRGAVGILGGLFFSEYWVGELKRIRSEMIGILTGDNKKAKEYLKKKKLIDESISKLIGLLGSEDVIVRSKASNALRNAHKKGIMSGTKINANILSVVSKLVDLLDHEDVNIRKFSAETLGNYAKSKIDISSAIPKLIDKLDDKEVEVLAVWALGEAGSGEPQSMADLSKAIPKAREYLDGCMENRYKDLTPTFQSGSVRILSWAAKDKRTSRIVTATLVGGFKEEKEWANMFGPYILRIAAKEGGADITEAVPYLIKIAEDVNGKRLRALEALEYAPLTGDISEVVPALVRLLEDKKAIDHAIRVLRNAAEKGQIKREHLPEIREEMRRIVRKEKGVRNKLWLRMTLTDIYKKFVSKVEKNPIARDGIKLDGKLPRKGYYWRVGTRRRTLRV